MSITTTNLAQAIMDTNEERLFWEVVRHHERPPFHFPEEGVGNRLNKAARVVYEARITPNSDGSYTVEGSPGHTYRVREHCSCPDSTYRKERPCYHEIAVVLYVEWKRRLKPLAPTFSPVVLGTLRAGTAPLPRDDDALGNGFPVDDATLPLPLPPTTVDERLAAAVDQCVTHALQEDRMPQDAVEGDLPPLAPREEGPVYTTSAGTRYTLPEGAIMPETDDGYIPEPDDAPVTVADAPVPPPRPLPGPVLLPSLDAQGLKRSMQEWSAQRQVIRSFLQQELKEGVDFYRLQVRGKDANPTLSKAGAEKFLGLFQLQASFAPDLLTWEMLGKPTDHVIYICTLRTRSGEIVGEGRGSRSLKKDSGDTNKAIKMSEKSALIDAVLRTGALSEVYTQDVEDLQEEPAPAATPPAKTPSQDLRRRIWTIAQERDKSVKTREDVESFVKARTGMTLHPDLYSAIVARLEEERP